MKIFRNLMCFSLIACGCLKSATIKGIEDNEIIPVIMSQINSYSKDSEINQYLIENDAIVISDVLKSFGYFDAIVKPITKSNKVTFEIELKERYKLNEISVSYEDQPGYISGLSVKQIFELLNIEIDSYTNTKQLIDVCEKIEDFYKNRGFAFVNVKTPKLIIDYERKKIHATFKIKLNGKTIIDKTLIHIKSEKDSKSLDTYIRNRIPWNDGDTYNKAQLSDLTDTLMKSNIFSGIDIEMVNKRIDKNDKNIVHVDADITLTEAPPREISAGIKYGSSEKLGLLFSWTHHNIDGKGSRLSAIADLTKESKLTKLRFDNHDVLFKKQDLSSQAYYLKEDVDAYNVDKFCAESISWHTFGNALHFGVGGVFEKSKTKDKIDEKKVNFKAFGIPLGLSIDTTDNYIDPQFGLRCNCMLTSFLGNVTNISVIYGKASFYLPIKYESLKNRLVLAFYTKVGSIIHDQKHKVPRDKLFFSGGANSVRGYGYQKIGPINEDKKPYGGRNLFEFGIEPRFKINNDFGVVAFLEGGRVYGGRHTDDSDSTPEITSKKKLLWGYGLGVRYYTMLGPIRVDIAFPSKRRKTSAGKKIDSLFNLYISVGQAF